MHCSNLDLLLIQLPNLEEPPYLVGAASLSAYLKKNGQEVKSFVAPSKSFLENPDLLQDPAFKKTFSNYSEFSSINEEILDFAVREILEHIHSLRPRFLGFSLIFGNVSNSIHCAQKIKVSFPNLPILFGGPGANLQSHQSQMREIGDFIFFGDSEQSVLDLLENHKAKDKIDGLDWKKQKTWISHSQKPYFESLDSIPQPDYSDFQADPYSKALFESIPLSLGRGCSFRCRFCSVRKYGLNYRQFSIESCIQFIESHLHQGKNSFYVHDPIINGNPGWIRDFCREIIKRNFKIYWGGNLRLAKYLNEGETLDLLFESGYQSIITGLESGSPNVLTHMRKYADLAIIDQIFEKIRKAKQRFDIKLNLQLIVGYPTETENDFKATLEFVDRHKDLISSILSCSSFMVIPSENEEMMDLMQDPNLQLKFRTDSNWSTPFSNPNIRLDRMHRAEKLFQNLKIPYRMFYGDRLDMIPQVERVSHDLQPNSFEENFVHLQIRDRSQILHSV
jgi:radical SAM superfamily enzyme YgiQ (UPF0313 family)